MGPAFPTKELFLSQKVSWKPGEASCLSELKAPDRAYLAMLAEMDLWEHKKDRMVGMGHRRASPGREGSGMTLCGCRASHYNSADSHSLVTSGRSSCCIAFSTQTQICGCRGICGQWLLSSLDACDSCHTGWLSLGSALWRWPSSGRRTHQVSGSQDGAVSIVSIWDWLLWQGGRMLEKI